MKKIIALVLISLIIISCGKKDESSNKLGVILSLSGNGAQYGKMILDGMNLAIDNYNGNNSEKFNLIVEDDKTEPKDGVSAAGKLINIEKINIILGPIASSVALAVAPICEENKILMLSPAASTPKLTSSGDYIFRIYPSDDYDGSFLANFLKNRLNINIASVLYLNNDFGIGLENKFETKFNELGGRVVSKEFFNQGNTDFRAQLSNIKNDGSTGFFIIATVNEYATILRQMKEMGMERKIIAPVTFDDPKIVELAGKAANGVYYSRPYFNPNSSELSVQEFVTIFKKKYNSKPSILHALGYDAVNLMIDQIKKNGMKATKIIKSLYNIKVFKGASGDIRFDKNGDVIKDLQIMVVENQKIIPYGE